MKKVLCILLGTLFLKSCIPLKIAPNISDYKTVQGKRFKKGLPKKSMFVFEDPKEAGAFYDYINIKYALNDYYVDVQVPFKIDQEDYYFSFYEVDIRDTSLNLFPILLDVSINAALGNDDFETYATTEENSIRSEGNFYIAIEVFSDTTTDALSKSYENRTSVLNYLRKLKEEYLTTQNYNEVVFKNK